MLYYCWLLNEAKPNYYPKKKIEASLIRYAKEICKRNDSHVITQKKKEKEKVRMWVEQYMLHILEPESILNP